MLTNFSKKFTEKQDQILAWIEKHTQGVNDPIYSSVDIRNAGYKMAPVDTNIFPGGFNNLCPSYQSRVGDLMKEHINKLYPRTKKVLIIPENHTRNTFYLSNVKKLENIFLDKGFKVKVGSLNEEITDKTTLDTADNEKLTLSPITREKNLLKVDNFEADLYLLNNDLSDGIPEILKDLEKPLIPSPLAGWHTRKKSHHFTLYSKLISEFAEIVEMDQWLLDAYCATTDRVDFSTKEGIEELASKVDVLIKKIDQKYKEYGIDEIPYVFIKNNSGTYGMGVTNVRSGSEILELNRKQRNKLNSAKSNITTSSVIIQEGLPTTDRFKDLVAEPVIYLANNQIAGGFFRLNEEKGYRSNLNSKGMKFTKLCFHELLGYSNSFTQNCNLECLSKIYKTIAQIASLAAGYETIQLKEENAT